MKSLTLKNCISTLERMRDAYSSRLDTGVLAEVDEVIGELKRLSERAESDVELGTLSLRALEVINLILTVVTNITTLMK